MSNLLTFGILQQAKNLPLWDVNTGGFFRGLEYYPVTSSTGRVWLDRNLGATRVATSSNDSAAYGYLFQWGRYWDGHEIRTSGTTTTNATTSVPSLGNSWDGLFIIEPDSPYDWLSTPDDNLWQGVNGLNNPCPPGYRLATRSELDAERLSWSSDDSAGAFASPLKWPIAGARSNNTGNFFGVGSSGRYWSSTVFGSSPARGISLDFGSNFALTVSSNRAGGRAMRCICDTC